MVDFKDYFKFFVRVKANRELAAIKRRVYTKVGKLKAQYVYSKEPIPYGEIDPDTLKNIRPGQIWSKEDFGCAWFKFKGRVPESASGKHIAMLIGLGAEGCLFDKDGTPIQGLSSLNGFIETHQPTIGKRYIDFTPSAEGGEEIDIWVEAGNNKLLPGLFWAKAIFKQADIVAVRDDIKDLYYDYLALFLQLQDENPQSKKHASIKTALKAASAATKKYDAAAVQEARNILKAEMANGEDSPYTVYSTGHAHLDLAWLWPMRETKRKAGRTFANALRNMERYPEYIFGASQPQQFEWIEDIYPKQFKQIKAAIESGAMEVQGGMWVESDTNVPSGEALIRQNLYGKRYWKEKFNKDMNFCWLPDVFGFSGNLPQILKKSGMDYFLTIKLSWNEHNKFPSNSFIWEGIDDSQVLVHMPPEGNYNSDAAPFSVAFARDNYVEKDVSKNFGMLYGVGDGGGGPGEIYIELALRQQDMKGLPKVKLSPAQKLFEALDKERDKFSVYKGELYLEKHQGTYTTQSKNKYFNRKLEILLHNVEFLYTAAAEKGLEYPREALDRIWKEVLLYQFHDIIPGSSIKRVYDESVPRYEKMQEELFALRDTALDALKSGKKLTAVNLTGYTVNELIRKDDKAYTAVIPPYGAAQLKEYKDTGAIKADDNTIESDLYIIKFGSNGNITSLVDKKTNKDHAGDYLNKLSVYKDKRLYYNAWDIDINYTKKKPAEFKLIGASTKSYGSFAVRENLYSYGKSSLTQKIIVTEGKPLIEFSTVVDWQETHKMLRAEFRPAVFADEVVCDIQMGSLKRSTKNETSVEKAQFEISAHKWVDVSENGEGFSVITDCKYGWRIKEGLMSLNLLRSPMWPAKDADKGTHSIKYALYPHTGDVFEAETAKHAYIFNNPPVISDDEVVLPSYAQSSAPNIVIETIKTAESGEGVIIRAYEDTGRATQGSIKTAAKYTEVYETDLIENITNPADLETIEFKPFEIKTFLLK
ncbi:MAG: glycoside hydrolase family 38 C-terminal domain-containing protein [Clostridia bacterium]